MVNMHVIFRLMIKLDVSGPELSTGKAVLLVPQLYSDVCRTMQVNLDDNVAVG
jgi:hypothetical protein